MRISDWSSDVCSSDLQHFAVRTAVLLGIDHPDRIEALLDRGIGFVDGNNALARGDHRLGDVFKLFDAHGWSLHWVWKPKPGRQHPRGAQIGRESCRESGWKYV